MKITLREIIICLGIAFLVILVAFFSLFLLALAARYLGI